MGHDGQKDCTSDRKWRLDESLINMKIIQVSEKYGMTSSISHSKKCNAYQIM